MSAGMAPRKRARCAVIALALVIPGAGCGGEAAPVQRSEGSPPSTPWLITLERATSRAGTLRAHRAQDGDLQTEMLDPSAALPMFWSPTGRWLAHLVMPPGEDARLAVRSFDGEVWHAPAFVTFPSAEDTAGVRVEWSPTLDQLLVGRVRGESAELAVAHPRRDGSIAMLPLDMHDVVSARWAPSGDRVVVARSASSGGRVTVVAISHRPELAMTPYEIEPPPGSTFDDVDPGHDVTPIRDGMISPDGTWMVFVVKQGEDDTTRALHAFSTIGASPSRALEGCPVSPRTGSGVWCEPYGWVGGATLLVVRRAAGGVTLEAWTPSAGTSVSLGNVTPAGAVGPRSARLLVEHEGSKARSIVDLRAPGRPVITLVPTTDQPSFVGATSSPDGRWLVLSHADAASNAGSLTAIELGGAAPPTPREIFRGDAAVGRSGFLWSPGGSFILVPDEDGTSEVLQRGTRIDLATGAATTIEVDVPPRDPAGVPFQWQWRTRMAPDDRTLAIPRDGVMALWQMDRPKETAVKLDDVPATAQVTWAPAR